MNKYFLPILCITASLALIPGCGKKTRDQKIEQCKKDLDDCGACAKSAGEKLCKDMKNKGKELGEEAKSKGKELKAKAKDLKDDASDAYDDTKWCGCEKK